MEGVNASEEYGVRRSFRRGTDVRALNARVPDPVNSAIN